MGEVNKGSSATWQDSPFMRACRHLPNEHTPIWLMRQAGRFLPSYRAIREKASFLQMCKTPELATEITLMPIEQLGVDAAILFADILLIAEPLAVGLEFIEGVGPVIARPVRTAADVDGLKPIEPASLAFVYKTVGMVRRALPSHIPLIGFCGAPFTVASYLIEGRSSRHFVRTKQLMYGDPGAWNALMGKLSAVLADYLNRQIAAGAQAVQIFDSWVGCLNEADYRRFVLPYTQAVIHSIRSGTPVIHFGVDSAMLLPAMRDAGGDVIGLDWRIELGHGWDVVGHDHGVQGNLDPAVLLSTEEEIGRQAAGILNAAAGRPGHIFNLGHGVLPETSVDTVRRLVDFVHAYGPGSQNCNDGKREVL